MFAKEVMTYHCKEAAPTKKVQKSQNTADLKKMLGD
jgi:hypothetical protein